MDRETILTELTEIVRDTLDLAVPEISEGMSLERDLELDSLRMVQLAVAAEDRFGVIIAEEETWDLHTIADAVTLIQRALRRQRPAAPDHAGGQTRAEDGVRW
ncbi:acyl carrier protein [Streptomyces sp. PTM05]|uniref:Acyl carrier protein n=1 Tax=Streptantibioticus parmotrematis TaxID=2873249 RepID=A0ABS7QSD3_9ACTN|nr:acyl carrier protein [Streptantibioticus parmotrematis]MBY8886101.1 acyl carrier protein [Streptantibioticus parmotrematis]